jgi:hypothetical protein
MNCVPWHETRNDLILALEHRVVQAAVCRVLHTSDILKLRGAKVRTFHSNDGCDLRVSVCCLFKMDAFEEQLFEIVHP